VAEKTMAGKKVAGKKVAEKKAVEKKKAASAAQNALFSLQCRVLQRNIPQRRVLRTLSPFSQRLISANRWGSVNA
jgi:hypothetical protein